jgi:hypothetical protein
MANNGTISCDSRSLELKLRVTKTVRWPRALRRVSAAAHLLGLWVRIPPGSGMFVVSVVCCQVEVSATG